MPHQTLSQIRSFLTTQGIRPKHRLGQNFLHDGNVMRLILETAQVVPGDLILEVGAGTGSLSTCLLDGGARLVAVEMDPDLKPILDTVLQPYGDAAVVLIQDVLSSKQQISTAVAQALADIAKPCHADDLPSFRLVANLPYNIASPLLANLAADWPQMTAAAVTVQREVADRITAAPGGKQYGPLTVVLQAQFEIKQMAVVAPTCFWPVPRVESAILRFERRPTPLTDRPAQLSQFVADLFGLRRKQLKVIVRRRFPGRTLPDDINPVSRPEQLSVEQLIRLERHLGENRGRESFFRE